MKLPTLLGVALAGAFAAPSWAQTSSVTVFGVMDAAVRSVSNEGRGSIKSLISGGNSTSRLGFRGTEDLGAGLSAGFHLEHGIAIDTGSPASATQFWDRRATVSLASASFGELRAGRDFVPTYVNWGRYDPFSYVGVASSSNFVSATPVGPVRSAFGTSPNTTVRASNAGQLLLPSGLGGLEGGFMLAAGEGGTVANGFTKVTSLRLGWAAGPFGVSAATASSENNLTGAGKFKDGVVAGSYNAGVVRVSAAYRQFKFTTARQTNTLVGLVVPLGGGEIKASWNRADLSGTVGAADVSANDADQIGLGYVHNLSKRTVLYGTVARLNNRGAATFVVPGGPAGLAGGGTSTGVEAGLRHNF